jgi:hypothetical protein
MLLKDALVIYLQPKIMLVEQVTELERGETPLNVGQYVKALMLGPQSLMGYQLVLLDHVEVLVILLLLA